MSGLLKSGTSGFGLSSVSGRNRVPRPAPSTESRGNFSAQLHSSSAEKSGLMSHEVAHRLHLALNKSMLAVEGAYFLGVVGQKGDAKKLLVPCESDRVLQKLGAISAAAMIANGSPNPPTPAQILPPQC
jgi:hypothetical protein